MKKLKSLKRILNENQRIRQGVREDRINYKMSFEGREIWKVWRRKSKIGGKESIIF